MQSVPLVLSKDTLVVESVEKKIRKKPNLTGGRMDWVDYARGLAILLVVYRHTMVGLNRGGNQVPDLLYSIQEFAVNFRMPVFFILSGIFLAKSLEKYSTSLLIRKKAATLLYPYVLWTVILISVQIILSNYTNSERTVADYLFIVTQPRNLDHMWYLLALFNTSILFLLSYKWFRNYPALHISFALLLHFVCYFIKDYSFFSDPFYYFIFFVIGVLVSKKLSLLEEKNTRFLGKCLLLLLPIFVAGQLFCMNQKETLLLSFPFLAFILVACTFFYFLCRFLQNIGFATWLTQVGKYSLYIYILHIFVISSFRIFSTQILKISNIYFLIGGSFLLAVILPILAYKLFSRWSMWYIFSLEKPIPRINNG